MPYRQPALKRIFELSHAGGGQMALINQPSASLVTITFAATDVNSTSNTIAGAMGAMVNQQRVMANANGGTLPPPLVDGQVYFIGPGIQLYATLEDAIAGNPIDFTSAGSGSGMTLVEQTLNGEESIQAIIQRGELAAGNGYTERYAYDPLANDAYNASTQQHQSTSTVTVTADGGGAGLSFTHRAKLFDGAASTIGDTAGGFVDVVADNDTIAAGTSKTYDLSINVKDNS